MGYTAEAISEGGWLSVTPESGMTPVNLRLTANMTMLRCGRHTATIRITSAESGGGGPLNVPVTIDLP